MKDARQWIAEYDIHHRHPANIKIHHICVPAITFALLGLLWHIDIPLTSFNLAHLLIVGGFLFYFLLSPRLMVGMWVLIGVDLLLIYWLLAVGVLLEVSAGVFVVAWILQFWGHHIEGARPSFTDDIRFLMIGPLWTLAPLYKKLGIRY